MENRTFCLEWNLINTWLWSGPVKSYTPCVPILIDHILSDHILSDHILCDHETFHLQNARLTLRLHGPGRRLDPVIWLW